ncbi:MAG: two pore domain potassium channel family protein [Hyphomicrobiales bacterium]|nr:two pore domain potassium channel family protein [Hyphomicrobiales bacterium]
MMILQIASGGALLSLSALSLLLCMILTVALLEKISRRYASLGPTTRRGLLVGSAVAAIVAGHTLVVWIWALALLLSGGLPEMEQAIYFSLVTYTTLGYGDIVLGQDYRVFGSMAAVTGLLNFGLSTAFLVAVVGRLFSDRLSP